ncbi:MAG: glycosyltransferase family 4 protein [Magnetococcales bacterium]|nr:glycosyltransferase family 4 protein [Magnetococcales bacterium]
MLRVCQVSPGGLSGRGGIGRFVLYLTESLRTTPGVCCRVVDSYGPGYFLLMPFWFIFSVLQVASMALLRRVDILHLHMASYGSTGRKLLLLLLGKSLGLKIVLHLHGADFVEFFFGLPAWGQRVLSAVMNRADRVVVIGCYWHDFVVQTIGLSPERVCLVHNGTPSPPLWSATVRPDPEVCHFLSLGELGERKGTPELLQALALLGQHVQPWSAVIAGNGAIADSQAQVNALGLADRVRLPGWIGRDEAAACLREADVFVLPSRQEGLPIAILEAMSMGRAIVATPVGAIPDAIEAMQTGLLVPPGDAAALAEALRTLLEDVALRHRLGEAARLRYQQMFHIDRVAERVLALYAALLAGAHQA